MLCPHFLKFIFRFCSLSWLLCDFVSKSHAPVILSEGLVQGYWNCFIHIQKAKSALRAVLNRWLTAVEIWKSSSLALSWDKLWGIIYTQNPLWRRLSPGLGLKLYPYLALPPSLSCSSTPFLDSPRNTSLIEHSNPWLRVCFWQPNLKQFPVIHYPEAAMWFAVLRERGILFLSPPESSVATWHALTNKMWREVCHILLES